MTPPKTIEIVISHDGKSVWINTEFGCAFRATRIEDLSVDDRRIPKNGDAAEDVCDVLAALRSS